MGSITSFVLLLFVLIIALLQLCCSQKTYPNVSCVAGERRALLQFRSSLVDRSNRLSSWSGEDCCNWEGVGCSKSTGHVVKLDLHNPIIEPSNFEEKDLANYHKNALTGEINTSLLSLEHLSYLDLSRNNFGGIQIPKFFGLLSNLRYLNLSGAQFYGKIPHDLGNLSHLQHLDLSDHDPFLLIPFQSISWVSKLSSLESLDLSGLSKAQNWFQAINMLPSLTSLKLSGCGLASSPKALHMNLTSLILLDFSGNRINSTIPLWFFNMTSLEYLDLSSNSIHGPIPPIISQLNSLTSLCLSYNEFAGSIPPIISQLNSLTSLELRGSYFTGSLPFALFCNLTSLRKLDLAFNKFEGAIPREIGCLRQLAELDLSLNMLNGNITSNLGQLRNLESLDISQNALMGEIQEVHFAELKELKYLRLSSNSFTLSVRSSWVPPFQLQQIIMDSVKIGPRFPSWLQTQKSLKLLYMYNASISDNIPDWFEMVHSRIQYLDLSFNNITGKVPNFEKGTSLIVNREIILSSNKFEAPSAPYYFPPDIFLLDISNNALSGPIPQPDDLGESFSIERLFLGDNYFSGSIPRSICHVRSLQVLDLSNNQLSGRLPLCLGNLRDLVVLKFGNNNLSGNIPSSLGRIKVLQYLHLNNNKFNGELPESFQYLRLMQFLDLGQNELNGIIPSWIGERLSDLRILRLQSNKFHGDIPLHLCQLSHLQVLNLAQNNLTGCIPRCFNNITAMVLYSSHSFRFYYYQSDDVTGTMVRHSLVEKLVGFMSGRELEYSRNLPHLISLDLSQNQMVGQVPDELTDLVGLENLKLSQNHFNGSIPDKIGNLVRLQSLDLSMNELSGSIPPSLANLHFLSYLNFSSNKLAGPIPTGNQLQTLNDPSIYANNIELCGKPLTNNCERSSPGNGPTYLSKDGKDSSFLWFLAGVGPGFGVGFLGIFSLLLFKKSWRQIYFQLVENLSNSAWVWITIKTSKLRGNVQ